MKKELKNIFDELSVLQDRLMALINDQEEKFDAKSEKWQESEKGEEAQHQIELLGEIHENMDNAGAGILEITE